MSDNVTHGSVVKALTYSLGCDESNPSTDKLTRVEIHPEGDASSSLGTLHTHVHELIRTLGVV